MKINIHSQTYTLAAGVVSAPVSLVGNCVLITSDSSTAFTNDIAVKIDDSGFKNVATGTKISLPGGATFSSVQFKNTGSTSKTFNALVLLGDAANYNLSLNGAINVATVTIDDATPVKVAQQGAVSIDDTTPVKVAQQGAVIIDDTTPVKVVQEGGVLINNATAIKVEQQGAVSIDDAAPIKTTGAGAAVGRAAITATTAADESAIISASAKAVIISCETNGVIVKDDSANVIMNLAVGDITPPIPWTDTTLKFRGVAGDSIVYVSEVQ